MGAPAHTVTNLTDVLMGISPFSGVGLRTHSFVYGGERHFVQILPARGLPTVVRR
jgi:hypothetical protein